MKLKSLLVLAAPFALAQVSPAATITLNPGDNALFALNRAKPGDVVQFAAGTFNLNAFTVPNGVTLQGAPQFASHVIFNLFGQNLYGMVLPANASNITITGLDLHSSNGLIRMNDGGGYSHIHIVGNQLQFGGGAFTGGVLVFGIVGSIGCEDLQITSNLFHDSLTSNRCWEVWGDQDSNLDHNLFQNVTDGGHLCEPKDNDSFSYNYGTGLRRMGQEIQGDTASHNLKVVGNVFYDWTSPYYDSFGLSVVNHNAIDTLIDSNYVRTSMIGGWGQADSGGTHRFGYCIESGGMSNVVSNNTMIMPNTTAAGVDTSRITTAKGNKTFGGSLWGVFAVEPGPNGNGSYTNNVQQDNTIDANAANGPQPPANNFAGPAFVPGATTAPSANAAQPGIGLTVTVLSNTSAQLTWTGGSVSGGTISIITTAGRQSSPPLAISGGATTAIVTGLHPGWSYDYTLSGTTDAGVTASSDVITELQSGDSGGGISAPALAAAIAPAIAPASTVSTTQPSVVEVDLVKRFSDGTSATSVLVP